MIQETLIVELMAEARSRLEARRLPLGRPHEFTHWGDDKDVKEGQGVFKAAVGRESASAGNVTNVMCGVNGGAAGQGWSVRGSSLGRSSTLERVARLRVRGEMSSADERALGQRILGMD